MENEMGRRDFLKFSLAAGALLAVGEATKGKLMAQEAGKIMEVDQLTIWVLTDNYFDTLRPDSKITKRYRVTPGKSIHAEHGLAYFVETVVNGQARACMFDYGLDPIGVMNNIAVLGLDVGKAQ
ncbi:MAG: twin-arginine translocation signal domain-containing protein, partial [Deltaproteobacteria bacterium]|nr:twin-arginine translocation signal domain-containing protein [Deltaproteobacteria bacterium]